MKLYELNEKITELINPETGEIMDYAAFEQLQLEHDAKIEGMAIWYKELNAEAKAIRDEEKSLAERRKLIENKRDRLKEYIATYTGGNKFRTPRVAISWHKSEKVIVDDGFVEWAKTANKDLLRCKDPEADKDKIKQAIKNGDTILHAQLESDKSISIK